MHNSLQRRLAQSEIAFGLWAGIASFTAYFCMYLFRKPYTASTYENLELFGLDYKIVLVISQVLGYALSKFIGIKLIAELDNSKRIRLFLGLIGIAWLALLGFAFSPPSWGFIWLFINGLPLGLIWGIVFSYCEGRRLTEILTVVLSVNFILSSGLAKTIGRWLLALGYSEQAMPMMVGLVAMPLLFLSLWMLNKIPPPSQDELYLKSERKPMSGAAKRAYLRKYGLSLFLFVAIYFILTLIRDIRDNFAIEIWTSLGYGDTPGIFSTTELPVTLVILLSLGLLYRISHNYKALISNVLIGLLGMILLLGSTSLYYLGGLSPVSWMIISGIGLFLPYILLNGIIFDRFIATYRINGNVGFIMYIADAFGYLGSIGVLLYKNFGSQDWQWLDFYIALCYIGGFIGLALTAMLLWVFLRKKQPEQALLKEVV